MLLLLLLRLHAREQAALRAEEEEGEGLRRLVEEGEERLVERGVGGEAGAQQRLLSFVVWTRC